MSWRSLSPASWSILKYSFDPAYAGTCHSRRIAIRPSTGPGSRSQATRSVIVPHNAVTSSMETMVMAKPTLFMKASALPTRSGEQALDASAENCGESATTKKPQATSSAILKDPGRPCTKG